MMALKGSQKGIMSPHEMKAAYLTGMTIGEVANLDGRSESQTYRILHRLGVQFRIRATRSQGVQRNGYRLLQISRDHPFIAMASSGGQIYEHRLVMAQQLNRLLTRHETVHHMNGDRADNRPENLQLRQGQHGNGQRLRCSLCGSHDIEMIEL